MTRKEFLQRIGMFSSLVLLVPLAIRKLFIKPDPNLYLVTHKKIEGGNIVYDHVNKIITFESDQETKDAFRSGGWKDRGIDINELYNFESHER